MPRKIRRVTYGDHSYIFPFKYYFTSLRYSSSPHSPSNNLHLVEEVLAILDGLEVERASLRDWRELDSWVAQSDGFVQVL